MQYISNKNEAEDQWQGEPLIQLGRIVKPHGVAGAMKVMLFSREEGDGSFSCYFLKLPSGEILDGVRWVGALQGGGIVKLPQCTSRNQAESYRDGVLMVLKSDIDCDDDEFLYEDLIGCKVIESKEVFGVVVSVMDYGASDILVVKDPDGREHLMPFVERWVLSVDLEEKIIEIQDSAVWREL